MIGCENNRKTRQNKIRKCGQEKGEKNNVTSFVTTVKFVYNDQPRDPLRPKKVAVVDIWLLFRGHLCHITSNCDLKWLLLLTGGRYSEVVIGLMV